MAEDKTKVNKAATAEEKATATEVEQSPPPKESKAKGKEYTVKTGIYHNKKEYRPGDKIRLLEKEAEPLLAMGAVK